MEKRQTQQPQQQQNLQPQPIYNFYDHSMNLPNVTEVNITHNHYAEESVAAGLPGDEEIVAELTPIFYGNTSRAAEFLGKIRGSRGVDVTSEVKRLVSEKVISEMSCRTTLYNILCRHGLYDKTIQNFTAQIRM